jgi:lysophospholipase L1-like esterase
MPKIKNLFPLYRILSMGLLLIGQTSLSQCCQLGTHSLEGNTENLARRLQLSMKQGMPINVVQIGDSHTQPGILNQPLSEILKDCMGSGGYGCAFPFQVAKTNGHDAYSTQSNVQWRTSRIIQSNPDFPIGLSGYTLYTPDIDAEISWKFDSIQSESPVKRISLFHASTLDSNFFYQISDYSGNKARYMESLSHSQLSVFEFNEPVYQFTLHHVRFHEYQKSSTLQGVFVESGNTGAICSSIGINGATYDHFVKARDFRNQLEQLNPDILVVSLGTNEAFQNEEFRDTLFSTQVDQLIQMLTSLSSAPELILMTPPAVSKQTYKKGKSYFIAHPNVPVIRKIIIEQAQLNHLSYFDWYESMGGENSMKIWAQRGLTDKKQIHFSPSGYKEIGEYFSESICPFLIKK